MTGDAARRTVLEAIEQCSLPSWAAAAPEPGRPDTRLTTSFRGLGFDSLTYMEFCIALHAATGVEFSAADVEALGTPDAVIRRLTEAA